MVKQRNKNTFKLFAFNKKVASNLIIPDEISDQNSFKDNPLLFEV